MLSLAQIERAQHGAFTWSQAIDAELSPSALKREVREGRFRRVYPEVYVDVAVRPSLEQQAIAACLACGPFAVVSHHLAARLWDLDVPEAALPEITVLRPSQPRIDGIRIYRTRHLSRIDVVTLKGVRVTGPMRMLVDVAPSVGEHVGEVCFDALWRRGAIRPDRMASYLAEPSNLRRPGSRLLRELAAARIGQAPPGSDLETLFLRVVRRYGLPLPERQHKVVTSVGPRYIDFAYVEHKVAVELEGFEVRIADRRIFDASMERQNLLEALGWTVLRFGWTNVALDPLLVAVRTAASIGLVPVRWKPDGTHLRQNRQSGP